MDNLPSFLSLSDSSSHLFQNKDASPWNRRAFSSDGEATMMRSDRTFAQFKLDQKITPQMEEEMVEEFYEKLRERSFIWTERENGELIYKARFPSAVEDSFDRLIERMTGVKSVLSRFFAWATEREKSFSSREDVLNHIWKEYIDYGLHQKYAQSDDLLRGAIGLDRGSKARNAGVDVEVAESKKQIQSNERRLISRPSIERKLLIEEGDEFQVNTYTTSGQDRPRITSLSDGGFVITWQSDGQDGNSWGVYAQRYDSSGNTVGDEFQVNIYTTGEQNYPSITSLNDGGFVVTWQSNGQDGNDWGVYAQRYDSSGNTVGTEFQVNTYTTSDQSRQSITSLSDGGFVIAWQSSGQDGSNYGTYAQRYNSSGNTVGSEFQVNTYTTTDQAWPRITSLSDGGFIIVWQSNGQDGSNNGVYAQRYDILGNTVGTEFQVNTYTTDEQRYPSIASLNDGGFVIAWGSDEQDGDWFGIYAQRYDSSGNSVGSEFQVNTYTVSWQVHSSITGLDDGGFIIAWNSNGQDGSNNGVYAQRYDSSGNTVGDEFRVNTYTTDHQRIPSITSLDDGSFVIAWQSNGQDGSGEGIYAKIYRRIPLSVSTPIADMGTNVGDAFSYTVPVSTFHSDTGDPLTYSAKVKMLSEPDDQYKDVSTVSWLSFDSDTRELTGIPNTFGVYSIQIEASDGTYTITDTFTLSVSGPFSSDPEFQVNTYTINDQSWPSITSLNDGGFIIAWQSGDQDGSGYGIYAQRYDSSGNMVGTEFQVNTYTTNTQERPSIASLSDGGFVIAWESEGQDGSSWGVYAQRYDSSGNTVGTEFQVNTYTTSDQSRQSITSLSDGGFIIAWQSASQDGDSWGVYSRRYDSSGNRLGDEFQVNTYTVDKQVWPQIMPLNDGGFIISWSSEQDGSGYGIYAQRYDSSGNTVGSEFQVSTHTEGGQQGSSIMSLSDEGFVIAWHSNEQDGNSWGVYAQRYDSSGNRVGDEFQVNTYTTENQSEPSITSLSNGGFIIVWQSNGQDQSSWGVYAQQYDSSGNRVGDEFRVNTYTNSNQDRPSITSLNDGSFVVAWHSNGQDGSGYGIYAKRYRANPLSVSTPIEDMSTNMGDALSYAVPVSTFHSYTGDPLTYSAKVKLLSEPDDQYKDVSTISWLSFDPDTRELTGTPNTFGVYSIQIEASDGVYTVTDAFTLSVSGPVFSDPEFRVNTYITNSQERTQITSLNDGGSVVVWQSNGQDGSGYGIYAQRYDGSGNIVGNEFQVNSYTASWQLSTRITSLSDGGFIITWQSEHQDGNSWGIYAQQYDSFGNTVGNEFRVNTYTVDIQANSSITSLSDGGFVVVWQSNGQDGSDYGIYAQRYDGSGNRVGDEFQVNTYTANNQEKPSITSLSDGGFVVVWQSNGQDGNSGGIYAQRYDSSGNTVEDEFQVNIYTTNEQRYPSIASLHDGGFVIAWGSDQQDGDSYGIYAQRYDSSGNATGTEFQVNTYTSSDQTGLSITSLSDGGFVIAWMSGGQDGDSYGIYAQRYDSSGNKLGDEFQVNTYTEGDQSWPSITSLNDGGFVIAWQSNGQDGSGEGIYAKKYRASPLSVSTPIEDMSTNVGDALSYTVPVSTFHSDTGDPLTYSAKVKLLSEPDDQYKDVSTVSWLSFDPDTRELTGVPNTFGMYSIQIEASDGVCTITDSFILSVSGPVVNGAEFQVNTHIANRQDSPVITSLNDGGFVVAWQSNLQDGNGYGIYAQRYDSSGNRVGSEFQVNTYTGNIQSEPNITTLNDGGFVIAWHSEGQDGSSWGVYAQRYDSSGNRLGDEFQVNTYTEGSQGQSRIISLSDGGFVITWNSSGQDGDSVGIYAQRYDSSGNSVGPEFQVNTYTDNAQSKPSITRLSDGGFLIAWQSEGQDGSNTGIYAQRYDSSRIGSEFQVNTHTEDDQTEPSITSLSHGGFVITWSSNNQDGNGNGIYAQQYDILGNTVGTEFQVNTHITSDQTKPRITSLSDGGFVITWSSNNQDGSGNGIYAQRYDVVGSAVGTEFQVNTYMENDQVNSSITSLSDGGFLIAWQSSGQDGSGFGIYAKRYAIGLPLWSSPSLSLSSPTADMNTTAGSSFSYTIPISTFQNSSNNALTYSAKVKRFNESDDQYKDVSTVSWLNFNPDTRKLTGIPETAENYTIQIGAHITEGDSTGTITDSFNLSVSTNTAPTLNNSIPKQIIPISQTHTWTYTIPGNTFHDADGEHISYTTAKIIEDGLESDISSSWLSFDPASALLSGIAKTSGDYTIRIYADDGAKDPVTGITGVFVDLDIEVVSQGIDCLELDSIPQLGSFSLITADESGIWISNNETLSLYAVSQDAQNNANPASIGDTASVSLSMPSGISSLHRVNHTIALIADDTGTIKCISLEDGSVLSTLNAAQIGEGITGIEVAGTQAYISHASGVTLLNIADPSAISIEGDTPRYPVTGDKGRMGFANGYLYIAHKDNGIHMINTDTGASNSLIIPAHSLGRVEDLVISEDQTMLYAVNETGLIMIDLSNAASPQWAGEWATEGTADHLSLSQLEGDRYVYVNDRVKGIQIIHVNDPLNPRIEGQCESTNAARNIVLSGSEKWGVVLEESRSYTVEIHQKELTATVCDTGSISDPCESILDIQAGTTLSKEISIAEEMPEYVAGYSYGYSYSLTASESRESGDISLPSWLSVEEIDSKTVRLSGEPPADLIGSVVHIRITADVFNSSNEKLMSIDKIIPLSITAPHASLSIPIADQSFSVGDEWLFSFPETTFNHADRYICEFKKSAATEWRDSADMSWIHFNPANRQLYVNSGDSIKERVFECNPCDPLQNSEDYDIRITAFNSASLSDTGVTDTFRLSINADKLAEYKAHPNSPNTIFLNDETISLPFGIGYTVSLVDENGDLQPLPDWIDYISSQYKLSLSPTISELGHEYTIQASGIDNGEVREAHFIIKVHNDPPIASVPLENQRVKLGESLEYQILAGTFYDADGDALAYSIKRVRENGSTTSILPSWLSFDSQSRTFYGTPSLADKGTITLRVSVNDGLNGVVEQDMSIEVYNNRPHRNPDVQLSDQTVHFSNELLYNVPSNLFIDLDGDGLTYTAQLVNGDPLPSWLNFNSVNIQFSGFPTKDDIGSLDIVIIARDSYESISVPFRIHITNQSPHLNEARRLSDQLALGVENGSIVMKQGQFFDFQFSSDTFIDPDGDSLIYTARLSNGDPLPSWLNFNARTGRFYGLPIEEGAVSISVSASDGVSSVTDTYDISISNSHPTVIHALQDQFNVAYPDPLMQGESLSFQFKTDSFQDADDSLSYTARIRPKNSTEWKELDTTWLRFDTATHTFFGSVASQSISNETFDVQVVASDGYATVSDEFSFTVQSVLPPKADQTLHIHSKEIVATIELISPHAKLAPISYNSATALDTSDNHKTTWRVEGNADDINKVLDTLRYRITGRRQLQNSQSLSFTLRIGQLEQSYPLTLLKESVPIQSQPITNQDAYMDESFSFSIAKYFKYDIPPSYSYRLTDSPSSSGDWLNFDSSTATLSGVPGKEGDIGEYEIVLTATDEFAESTTETIHINVDYTNIQKMLQILTLLAEIAGPALAVIGFIRYKASIYNVIRKSTYQMSPLDLSSEERRQLWLLREDEEKLAHKLYKMIKKRCPEEVDLCQELDASIQAINRYHRKKQYASCLSRCFKHTKKPAGQTYVVPVDSVDEGVKFVEVEPSELPLDKNEKSPFEQLLEMDGNPSIKIEGKDYHAKFIYDCVLDSLNQSHMNKKQKKAYNALLKIFKSDMKNISQTQKNKQDAWARVLPDPVIGQHRLHENKEIEQIEEFIGRWEEHPGTEVPGFYEAFYTSIRKKQWNDISIRTERSALDDVKVVHEERPKIGLTGILAHCMSYRLLKYLKWTDKKIPFFVFQEWLKVSTSEGDVTVAADPASVRNLAVRPIVQVYDHFRVLKAEYPITFEEGINPTFSTKCVDDKIYWA